MKSIFFLFVSLFVGQVYGASYNCRDIKGHSLFDLRLNVIIPRLNFQTATLVSAAGNSYGSVFLLTRDAGYIYSEAGQMEISYISVDRETLVSATRDSDLEAQKKAIATLKEYDAIVAMGTPVNDIKRVVITKRIATPITTDDTLAICSEGR